MKELMFNLFYFSSLILIFNWIQSKKREREKENHVMKNSNCCVNVTSSNDAQLNFA